MPSALHLPFQAYHQLREWYLAKYRKDLPDMSYQNRLVQTYYDGMRHWFHHQPAEIRVFSYDEDNNYADVQYEIYIGESSIQVYLMTLITPRALSDHYEAAADFGIETTDFGAPIEDLTDPFCRPTVVWDADRLDPPEIINAVEAWSRHFWPDFNCGYQYEMIQDGISGEMLDGDFMDWRAFTDKVSDSHCKVLLQCDPAQIPEIKKWAVDKGCDGVYVSQSHLILLESCPIAALPELEKAFTSIDFVVASSPSEH